MPPYSQLEEERKSELGPEVREPSLNEFQMADAIPNSIRPYR